MPGVTPQRWLAIVVVMMNLLVWSLGLNALYQNRQHHRERTERSAQNLVLLLERNIAATSRVIDTVLQAVVEELEAQLQAGALQDTHIDLFLRARQAQLPEIDALRVTDAAGTVRWGKGVRDTAAASYADRDFFREHRARSMPGLLISPPLLGRVSGLWVVAFTRAYHHADGQFAGVVSAAVPVSTYSALLSALDVGATGTVALYVADQGLITRYPERRERADLPESGVVPEWRDLLASSQDSALLRVASTSDGIERIHAFRRLDQWPLILEVGLGTSEHDAAWN